MDHLHHMDYVSVLELELPARIGIRDEERQGVQPIRVSIAAEIFPRERMSNEYVC